MCVYLHIYTESLTRTWHRERGVVWNARTRGRGEMRLTKKVYPWITLLACLALCCYQVPYSSPSVRFTTLQTRLASYMRLTTQQNLQPDQFRKGHSHDDDADSDSLDSTDRHHQESRSRVAICLVGGARSFEITAPTIKKHVLDVYKNADVFLHSPLDKDAFKLFLLAHNHTSTLAAARIFNPQRIPEQEFHHQLLTSSGSPNGIQGLLQYFNLVEGCWDMITEYESRHKFEYDWIVRTRVDGFWKMPIPSISTFKRNLYFIPYGSQFGGLNDRLGIGDRKTSRLALQRLTCLRSLHEKGYRNLNSERAFKAVMKVEKVNVEMREFGFCVLSRRKYKWPPGVWDVPVMGVRSKGRLNGAKCRPCSARLRVVGKEAEKVVESMKREWSWSGEGSSEGVEMCDASGDWEENWADIFEGGVGNVEGDLMREARRQVAKVDNKSLCVDKLTEFSHAWNKWEIDIEQICSFL